MNKIFAIAMGICLAVLPAAAQLDIGPNANFAVAQVSGAHSSSATTVTLKTGDGAKLPAASTADGSTYYNAIWWNASTYSSPADDPNVEIVRVTNRSTDTLTVTRAQEGTSAVSHSTPGRTYKIMVSLTLKTWNEIRYTLPTSGSGSPEGVVDGYYGRVYIDTTGPTTYTKQSDLGTLTGWAAGGGGGAWGSITGTLSSQTDLQSALDAKAPLANPTFTGTFSAPHLYYDPSSLMGQWIITNYSSTKNQGIDGLIVNNWSDPSLITTNLPGPFRYQAAFFGPTDAGILFGGLDSDGSHATELAFETITNEAGVARSLNTVRWNTKTTGAGGGWEIASSPSNSVAGAEAGANAGIGNSSYMWWTNDASMLMYGVQPRISLNEMDQTSDKQQANLVSAGGNIYLQFLDGATVFNPITVTRGASTNSAGITLKADSFTFSGGAMTGNGSGLTMLNGSNISSGTISDARLSANVPLLNTVNHFANINQFDTTRHGTVDLGNQSGSVSTSWDTNICVVTATGDITDFLLSGGEPSSGQTATKIVLFAEDSVGGWGFTIGTNTPAVRTNANAVTMITLVTNVDLAHLQVGSDYSSDSGGTDSNAIHVNVAGEITGITAKATPTTSDHIVIEDAAATDAKKSATLNSLPISSATQTALDLKANSANAALSGTTTAVTVNAGSMTITNGIVDLSITPTNQIVLVGDSGQYVGIPNGTSGQVLTANGAGSAPTFQDAAAGGGGADSVVSAIRQTVPLHEEFFGTPSTSQPTGQLGLVQTKTGGGAVAVGTVSATETTAPGALSISTTSTSTDYAGVGSASTSIFLFGGGTYTNEWRLKLSAAPDATDPFTVRIGFGDATSGNPTDGVYFLASNTNANWQCVTASNSTYHQQDSGVAIGTSWARLTIEVAADGATCAFRINGTSVATDDNAASGQIPNTAIRQTGLMCTMTRTATGANTRYMYDDYAHLDIGLTSSR